MDNKDEIFNSQREILHKQMQLLAEYSQNATTDQLYDVAQATEQMLAIHKTLFP